MILKSASIVSAQNSGAVSIGSAITVERGSDKVRRTFMIVGSEEANPTEAKISNESPLGKAVLGKKKGDKLEVKTPGGLVSYHLISIK